MPNTPSPLRYPGGKTKLYSYVRRIIEVNGLLGETYIEPFAGGAGLALKLLINGDVKRIVINDFDPAIYSFWNNVLNNTDDICNFIRTVEISVDEWTHQREVFFNQDEHTSAEIAKATLYLNRTNVSGILTGGVIGGQDQTGTFSIDARFNREGLINKMVEIADLFDRVDLYDLDAVEFLNTTLPHYYKAFINFDPPYVNKGGQLYKNAFTQEDHKNLRDAIAKCKRKWIVTYDVCELIADLYGKFRGDTIDIYYSANSSRKSKEYIYFSNNLILP